MPPPASFAKGVKPGFTGHDEEDEFGLIDMNGRIFDPRLGRFTTTDPAISNVFNGQTLNGFSYVANNPLTFIDPSGFSEEEAWRQWRVEETGSLGIHITFDKLTPPREANAPAADVGVRAPTHDVGTTGDGGNGSSASTPDVEPIPARSGFGDGVWDGVVDAFDHLDEMVPGSNANTVAQLRTMLEVVDAYKKGDAIDAINVVNPATPFASVAFAFDDEDWYTVGRGSVAIVATIGAAVVAKRLGTRPTARSSIGANAAQGKLFEAHVAREMEAKGWTVAREVTLEAPSGARTRMDIIGKRGDAIVCVECKSSANGTLTPAQAAAHPQIATDGAMVVGKGKPVIPGGSQVPPSFVQIRRP